MHYEVNYENVDIGGGWVYQAQFDTLCAAEFFFEALKKGSFVDAQNVALFELDSNGELGKQLL